jgi:hypothetical protein
VPSCAVVIALVALAALPANAPANATDAAQKPQTNQTATTQTVNSPASDRAPAADARKPAASIKIEVAPSWPKTLPEAKAEKEAATKPPEVWAPAEIAAAKARCDVILKKIAAVAIPEAPIKQGACGTPAPIQLISIGRKPEVSISPPAIVTCEMAEALNTWLENDLQPLARKSFNTEIIKIETMSSYSCRNAYGRKGSKLSEHGLANALDIRGFVTASAKTAYILEDWGKPQREIVAEIAAAKAAEEKAAAIKAAAEKAAQANQLATKGSATATPPSATASTAGAPAGGIARRSVIDGVPALTVTIPGAKAGGRERSDYSFAEPDRLGGPKSESSNAAPQPLRSRDFLHAAHSAACRIFGTTLGPEANASHRNHFHIDMAYRRVTKICD